MGTTGGEETSFDGKAGDFHLADYYSQESVSYNAIDVNVFCSLIYGVLLVANELKPSLTTTVTSLQHCSETCYLPVGNFVRR